MTDAQKLEMAQSLIFWSGFMLAWALESKRDDVEQQSRAMIWQAHILYNELGIPGMVL